MKYIRRAIQPALKNALNIFPVVSLCGPRQSGKTTLCRMEFPEMQYVNLEDYSTRTFAEEDPNGFLKQFRNGVIIDEAQLVPELFNQIQVIVDEDRFKGNMARKFILTGSSNFSLLPTLRQSLAGRTGMYFLLPLSCRELEDAGRKEKVEDYILKGGYPAVWDNPEIYRSDILNNYIETYVERDVRRLMEVKDLKKFSTFLRLCAARTGSELNKSSLAVELGISIPTIERWISVLEASFVIYLMQPWAENIGKRLTKTPKLYFTDTGIVCTLLGIKKTDHLMGHPLRGALFENLVISNVLKDIYNHGERETLYFYRDKTGREIDLIREDCGKIEAVEIKAGNTFNNDYFRNIRYLKSIVGDKLVKSSVIYSGESEFHKAEEGVINFRNYPKLYKIT